MNVMKRLKNILALSFVMMLGAFLMSNSSVYAGLGISPGGIFNDHLKPGAHLEEDIIISRSDPDEELIATIEPDLGEMNDWFKFVPGRTFILPKGEQQVKVKAIVDVPSNVQFKDYTGYIRVKAQPEERPSGVSIVKGARLEIAVATTEFDVSQLIVRSVKTNSPHVGDPLELSMLIENSGNTDLAPTKITIDFTDLQDKSVDSIIESDIVPVPAYETKTVTTKIIQDLPAGEYFANVKVWLGDKLLREEKVVVNVLAKEAVQNKDKGSVSQYEKKCESTGFIAGLANNKPFAMLLMAVLVGIVLVGWIDDRRKSRVKIEDAAKTGGFNSITYSVAGTIIILMIVLLALIAKNGVPIGDGVSDCTNELTTVIVKPADNNLAEANDIESPEVLGAKTETPEYKADITKVPTNVNPLVVKAPENASDTYQVYAKPDITSKVVLKVTAGTKFSVVDEVTDWYQIRLENGQLAWLPKASVAQVNQN